jgi:DNA topoisomerase-2
MDDGERVEPDTYLPVVPLLAINGSVGIGTGFSTDIPPHNPREVVAMLNERLNGTYASLAGKTLDPWWIGFRGKVEKKADKQWVTRGVYTWDDAAKAVKITELPVGTWTKDYKAFLDGLVQANSSDAKEDGKPILKGFEDLYNDVDVNFTLFLEPSYYASAKTKVEEFEKRFHLTTSWKTTNMCCFDTNMNIVKYDTIGDILESFYTYRLAAYEKRRQHQITVLKDDYEECMAKYQFLKAIVEGHLHLMNAEDEDILRELQGLSLPPRSKPTEPNTLAAYDYLLRMRVDRIKKSSVQEAEKEAKTIKQAIDELERTAAADIWRKDLAEFTACWEKTESHMMSILSAATEGKPTSGGGKKKLVVKRKT